MDSYPSQCMRWGGGGGGRGRGERVTTPDCKGSTGDVIFWCHFVASVTSCGSGSKIEQIRLG